MPTNEDVIQALRRVNDPEIGRNLVDLHMIQDLQIGVNGLVAFTIALTVPACPLKDVIERNAVEALEAISSPQTARPSPTWSLWAWASPWPILPS